MTNKFIIKNYYAELTIISKKYGIITTFIDVDDVEKLRGHSWFITDYKNKTISTKINKKNIKLHRFITNCPNGMVVDHINHNRLDNRKRNLRICTVKENNNNLLPNCKHGKYIFEHRNKFQVKVPKNGKNMHLGTFATFDEAKQIVINYINSLWELKAI